MIYCNVVLFCFIYSVLSCNLLLSHYYSQAMQHSAVSLCVLCIIRVVTFVFLLFRDPEGLRVFYYLVQDLKCLVFSLIGLHFKIKPI